MKRIITFLIAGLVTFSLFGQDNVVTLKRAHEFGFNAGATTGIGLSYRYWPNKTGFQITALPIKTEDETFINVGLAGLHTFYDSRLTRFFGYLGSSYVVEDYMVYEYVYNSGTGYYDEIVDNEHNTKLNIGFGPGFAFGSRVRINIMAGYGFYDILGDFNIFPTGEIGLFFRL